MSGKMTGVMAAGLVLAFGLTGCGGGSSSTGCPPPLAICEGECTDLQYDPANCGTCGTACATGEYCVMGVCQSSCGEGLEDCSGICVDTSVDPDNCGACGTVCAAGEVCDAGVCTTFCGTGLTDCSGVCVDTDVDPANCGACDAACATGEVCDAGTCALFCGVGLTDCSGSCVDTDVDPAHCGACDAACSTGEVCDAGTCTFTCSTGLTDCSGSCRDLLTDRANCGACAAACSDGEVCSSGSCALSCETGLTDCSGSCRDLLTDRANCGACGTSCSGGEICTSGSCVVSCGTGLTDCSGVCVDLSYDPANCGACGAACGTDEACYGGTCYEIVTGFTGATGTSWESVASGPSGRGLQSWVPSGETYMYYGSSSNFGRLDISAGTWATRAAPPSSLAGWGSPALSNGFIWEIRPPNVLRYDPTANTWTTVRTDVSGSDEHAMTVTDGAGNLWSYNGSANLIEYDPVGDSLSYHATGISTSDFETRLGYDGPTNSIYFGGFGAPNLYRYDIATGVVTTLASIPESMLNDIFCADHYGHLYAAGNSSGSTIWQYDIATDTWARIVDYPVDHGNNGSCGVLEDGWLYVEPGSLSTIYRIELL